MSYYIVKSQRGTVRTQIGAEENGPNNLEKMAPNFLENGTENGPK